MMDLDVEFSEEEYERVKMAAAISGMSIDDFVIKAITDYLNETEDD